MSSSQSTPDTRAEPARVAELSPRAFWASYAIVVVVFLVVDNPVFGNPFDIDRSILYSYAPIPLLVGLFLALERKLGVVSFILGTVKLTTIKFGTTYLLAIGLWVARGAPPPHSAARLVAHSPNDGLTSGEATAPAPTPIDPARTAHLRGVIASAKQDAPRTALVFVAKGLDDFVFAPPAAALELTNGGRGFTPAVAVLQTFQPITLRSTDGRLHTAVAVDEAGHTLFNRPLIAAGTEQRIVLTHASGWVRLRCSIHPDEEDLGSVLVLAHPFWTNSSDDGDFELKGVPFGTLTLAAVARDGRRGEERITVNAPEIDHVVLRLADGAAP